MTDDNLKIMALQKGLVKENPDSVYGKQFTGDLFNTRDGGRKGTEINMHDDEPIIMGEVNMDDSEDSGSEGELTADDKKNYLDNIKKADKLIGLKTKKHHKKHNKNFIQTGFEEEWAHLNKENHNQLLLTKYEQQYELSDEESFVQTGSIHANESYEMNDDEITAELQGVNLVKVPVAPVVKPK